MKTYLVEVLIKKVGPVAAASLVSTLMALLAAHQGLLENWGITFGQYPLTFTNGQVPSGPVILIELDTLSSFALSIIAPLIVSLFALGVHHTTALVTGSPQTGGMRATDVQTK